MRGAGRTVEALQRPQVVERLRIGALAAVHKHAVAHPHDGVRAARRRRRATAGQLPPLRRAYVQHMHRVEPLYSAPQPQCALKHRATGVRDICSAECGLELSATKKLGRTLAKLCASLQALDKRCTWLGLASTGERECGVTLRPVWPPCSSTCSQPKVTAAAKSRGTTLAAPSHRSSLHRHCAVSSRHTSLRLVRCGPRPPSTYTSLHTFTPKTRRAKPGSHA